MLIGVDVWKLAIETMGGGLLILIITIKRRI